VFIGLDMQVGGARSLVEQFFLVHIYDPSDGGARALGGISQSWTLVVELSFYAFLPLYAFVMRRAGARFARQSRLRVELGGLALLYVISVGWRAAVYWVLDDGGVRNLAQYWLPAQLDLFAMGMFLAVMHVWHARRTEPVPALDAIGRLDWLWWCCAALAFTAVTFWVGLPDILQTVFGVKAYAKQFLYGLTAFFMILPVVFGRPDRGPVRRFLQWAPLAYLGTISYGIYLWHQAFLKKVHEWGGWAPDAGEAAIMSFRGNLAVHVLAALALSVVVATASWYLVERPMLRRKHRPLVSGRR
jgi:peptidoglycan/LPS O-acetylase OafA/YrhL